MKHDRENEALNQALSALRQVPPPDQKRQAAERLAFMDQARRCRQVVARPQQTRWDKVFWPFKIADSRRMTMIRVCFALAMIMIVGTSGMIYAADAAVPGDLLYGVDQAVESVRLGLTINPEAAATLLSSYANERLQEADQLSAAGDVENEEAALESYGDIMLSLEAGLVGQDPTATTVPTDTATVEPSVTPTETATVEPSVTPTQTATVEPSVTPTETATVEPSATPTSTNACVGADPHPVAEKLAEEYDVSYEDIMSWFCEGHYGFGEIKHALEASQETGIPPEDLLAIKTELGGWGEVWEELGLKGNHGGSKNKPDDATDLPDDEAATEADGGKDKPDKDKDKDKDGDGTDEPGGDKGGGSDKDKPGSDKGGGGDKDDKDKDKGGGKKAKP